MKKLLAGWVMLLLFAAGPVQGQKALRSLPNKSFKPGELLKFRVHYGFIDAGVVEMEVKNETKSFGSRKCLHIVGTGRTVGTLEWFFKIRDTYETYIDQDAIVPLLFIRRVNEGGFKINENVVFNPYQNTATSEKGTFPVPDNVQDLLSSYYYSRCLDVRNIKEGDVLPIQAFLDNEIVSFNLKFIGRETIKTTVGKVKCLMFRPLLQQGRVFREQEGMTVWISDDDNHIPVRVEAKLLVGSIKMDISDYRGLANPFSARVN
jgi:hypothetical protein